MATTQALIDAIKLELKTAGLTYKDVAEHLQLAESTVKRMFAAGDIPLPRIDEITKLLKIDFADLARQVADAQTYEKELTDHQEREVVKDTRLLAIALACLSHWPLHQMVEIYNMTEAECVQKLAQLDRLGIIELRPLNRYRLRVDKTVRWRPNGPAMQWFRANGLHDYFSGGFGGEGETWRVIYGSMAPASAVALVHKLERVVADFAAEHGEDQRLPAHARRPFTMMVGMRSWWIPAFRELMRS